jgi:hypothetical protein
MFNAASKHELIPKFNHVKDSKCHACVQSKQTHEPHKAAEPRNLTPLELVHFNLFCEMNDIRQKAEKILYDFYR